MQSVALVQVSTYLHTAAMAGAMNTGLALGWGEKGCADCGLETATETQDNTLIHRAEVERWRRDSQLCFSRGFI